MSGAATSTTTTTTTVAGAGSGAGVEGRKRSRADDSLAAMMDDDVDNSDDSESVTDCSTALSEVQRASRTARDINLVANYDNVPRLSGDKVFEAVMAGDTVIKVFSVVRRATGSDRSGTSQVVISVTMVEGKTHMSFQSLNPPMINLVRCRAAVRMAEDGEGTDLVMDPIAVSIKNLVVPMANMNPTDKLIMTIYKADPNTLVVTSRDPEEGAHGEVCARMPIQMPSEDAKLEPPAVANTNAAPFSKETLAHITALAISMSADVRFKIYTINSTHVLLVVKIANDKDPTTSIWYKYIMRVSVDKACQVLHAAPADMASDELEEIIRAKQPSVDNAFNAVCLRVLTQLPSMGSQIVLYMGGESGSNAPLTVGFKYGDDTIVGAIIMPNLTDDELDF